MINGAYVVVYSEDAEADRAFFRDILGFASADAGQGWLIFGLRTAEVALHPAEGYRHELYLMCDDLKSERAALQVKGVECAEVGYKVRHQVNERRRCSQLPKNAQRGCTIAVLPVLPEAHR
jgi:hypothetical protein